MTRAPASVRRTTPPQPLWYEDASCRGKSQLFYPPPNETASHRAMRERYAAVVCASCPALVPCRDWAREQREFGFWGGESEAARIAAGFVPRNVAELRVAPRSNAPLPPVRPTQAGSDRRMRTMVP
jgi:WhiB family redox-sensing transcriptional regulator